MVLFQLLDAVVPEHILPVISLLVRLPLGFVLKALAGGLFAGIAAFWGEPQTPRKAKMRRLE